MFDQQEKVLHAVHVFDEDPRNSELPVCRLLLREHDGMILREGIHGMTPGDLLQIVHWICRFPVSAAAFVQLLRIKEKIQQRLDALLRLILHQCGCMVFASCCDNTHRLSRCR